jgi:GAF domain-containing protein
VDQEPDRLVVMMTEAVAAGAGDVAELGLLFAKIATALHRSDGVAVDPVRLVRLAASAIPHANHCSVTLLQPRRQPQPAAASGPLAATVEELQHSLGEGPCLDAAVGDDLVLVNDLGVDRRWPRFSPVCVQQTGVQAILAVRLGLSGPQRAAINFYATSPGAFADVDVSVATVLAPLAASALQAQLAAEKSAQLEVALTTSRQIGAAVGITMAQRGLTYEQAFEALRQASQHLNVKLRDLAAEVQVTGVVPDPPQQRS